MAKTIRLGEIDDYALQQLELLIKTATLEADKRLKERTPVDTGRLRASWQKTVEPLRGSVFNNVAYAAPVIAGTDLPPSWQGVQRTEPFLEIVAKDIQTYVETEAARIGRSS